MSVIAGEPDVSADAFLTRTGRVSPRPTAYWTISSGIGDEADIESIDSHYAALTDRVGRQMDRLKALRDVSEDCELKIVVRCPSWRDSTGADVPPEVIAWLAELRGSVDFETFVD